MPTAYSTQTNDEFRAEGEAWFADLKRRIHAATIPNKEKLILRARAAHLLAQDIGNAALGNGDITVFSGGDKTP